MSAALPIFDYDAHEEPREKLVGIARLASLGEHLADGHQVEYHTLPVRSLLNRCTSPRMPFTWTINPYRGCEFACKYCYARYTHEFMELRDGVDFERKIYVKQEAAARLRRDLKRVKRDEAIALGTATDPYQPAERRYGITRAVLEEFALHRGFDIGIVTKSDLILRDVEVLKRVAEQNELNINITITTLNTDLARILEPRAPRPDLRMETVRKLCAAGLNAGVICAPVLPGITDAPADLEALVCATAKAGGHWIYWNALFLKPCSAAIFLPFLEKNFPHLLEDYRKRYGAKAFLSRQYRQKLSLFMRRLRRKYGLEERKHYEEEPRAEAKGEEQLALFTPPSAPAVAKPPRSSSCPR
jgi:DNA repair photolyase